MLNALQPFSKKEALFTFGYPPADVGAAIAGIK